MTNAFSLPSAAGVNEAATEEPGAAAIARSSGELALSMTSGNVGALDVRRATRRSPPLFLLMLLLTRFDSLHGAVRILKLMMFTVASPQGAKAVAPGLSLYEQDLARIHSGDLSVC